MIFKNSYLCSIVILFLFLNCSSGKTTYEAKGCPPKFHKLNFHNLIDSAAFYNDQYIEVSGYYHWSDEESAISEFRRDADPMIWIEFDPDIAMRRDDTTIYYVTSLPEHYKMQKKKITTRGVVDTNNHGHLGQYKLTVKRICWLSF